jgi:hypothetical protein
MSRSLAPLAFLFFAFASTGCIGSGCNPDEIPESDTCELGNVGASLDRIQIGAGEGDSFEAFSDGSIAQTVVGGQGSMMIPIHLRVEGSNPPRCMIQQTNVTKGEELVASETRSLTTYEADGGRVTGTIFLILNYGVSTGDQVVLSTSAYSTTAQVAVWLENVGQPVPDAAGPDGEAPIDAALPADADLTPDAAAPADAPEADAPGPDQADAGENAGAVDAAPGAE